VLMLVLAVGPKGSVRDKRASLWAEVAAKCIGVPLEILLKTGILVLARLR
jgi:hypothetical protein